MTKTHALISLLALEPTPQNHSIGSLSLALGAALLFSVSMVVGVFGLNANLTGSAFGASFLYKMLCLSVLAVCSAAWLWRTARPARHPGYGAYGMGLALLAIALAGAYIVWQADPQERPSLLLGQSWWSCPLGIVLIAWPWLVACLLYLRQMAPTRLALSGTVAGFLSGTLAAGFYSLHCTETSFAFFSIWYVSGIALCSMAGFFLGPRWLRW